MPPRLRSQFLEGCLQTSHVHANRQGAGPSPSLALRGSNPTPASAARRQQPPHCGSLLPVVAAPFSTSSSLARTTDLRKRMFTWLRKYGKALKHPPATEDGRDGGYVTQHPRQPFPLNTAFKSTNVLSEGLRTRIYEMVKIEGSGLKQVSAMYGVDIRRVAAVVRMKEIETKLREAGKQLATPYSKAIMAMLPKTGLGPDGSPVRPHEPVNEIHVHSYTMQQLFWPVSESRYFTRRDAAKAFGEHILPADDRVALPELVQLERDRLLGMDLAKANKKFEDDARRSEQKLAEKVHAAEQRRRARIQTVETDRFEFRFERTNVDNVGRNGRSRKGVGWRYGLPFQDRKRGQIKIPTSVG